MVKKHQYTVEQIDKIKANATLTQADFDLINSTVNQSNVFIENGVVKSLVQGRAVKQEIAHIDWLNFTFHESTIESLDSSILTDNDLIICLSRELQKIFGFGITSVRKGGAFFYDRSYELGNNYGIIGIGGQNNTILVSINATGLSHASDSWQDKLYQWLQNADRPSISRIDLAHDDFEPVFFNLDNVLLEYKKGAFNNRYNFPSCSQAGNWVSENTNGRTFYVGKRANGLYCRIYEKGLQLGSKDHPNWVRVEVELKSVDRIIPFEVLLRPHHYLAASYPILNRLTQIQQKIEVKKHEVRANIAHRVKWGKRQQGSLIYLLHELGYSNDEVIEQLIGSKIPAKFKQKFLDNDLQSVHLQNRSEDARLPLHCVYED